MLDGIIQYIEIIKDFLWSGPLLIILFLVGIHQTITIKGLQFSGLLECLQLAVFNKSNINKLKHKKPDFNSINKSTVPAETTQDLSAFEAMMTALAGSIGTGNIAGISTALAVGGVGALFWMWLVAAFGMATAYAETVLSIKYRIRNIAGELSGGPMYYLCNHLKFTKTAILYAFLVILVSITLGCLVQSHSVIDAITSYYDISKLSAGLILMVVTASVIIGGIKTVGKVASILVPFMAMGYLLTGLIILIFHYQQILPSIGLIFKSAFIGQAPVGGFLGSTIWMAMQNGAQYGVFANEAGLGSLAIAAASTDNSSPVEQGMRSVAGVFIATMVICTITGLMLAVTGVIGTTDHNGLIKGSRLVMLAVNSVHHNLSIIVIFSLAMFAFTTILAWAYYGEKSIEYLFGVKLVVYYRWIFTAFILIGALLQLDVVWSIANLSTALMSIPNLIAITLLYKEVKFETVKYFAK